MAYLSRKDVADVTYNSTDLKAYVVGISGLKEAETVEEWRAPGSAYMTRDLTGLFNHDPIVIEFVYEDSASGPNVKCAKSTSATLTVTFISGQNVTGTFLVSEREVVLGDEGDNHLIVTFLNTGTVTTDFAA